MLIDCILELEQAISGVFGCRLLVWEKGKPDEGRETVCRSPWGSTCSGLSPVYGFIFWELIRRRHDRMCVAGDIFCMLGWLPDLDGAMSHEDEEDIPYSDCFCSEYIRIKMTQHDYEWEFEEVNRACCCCSNGSGLGVADLHAVGDVYRLMGHYLENAFDFHIVRSTFANERSNQVIDKEAACVLITVNYLKAFDYENRNQRTSFLLQLSKSFRYQANQPSRQEKYPSLSRKENQKAHHQAPFPGGMEVGGYENP